MNIEKIIDAISTSNSPALFALIAGVVFIAFFREYTRMLVRLREMRMAKQSSGTYERHASSAQSEESEAAGSVPEPRLPYVVSKEPGEVVDSNFRILERYYDQNLAEFKLNARASLAIASLGFMVIITGVFLALSGYTPIGLVTSVAGVIAEAATVLFFKQNKVFIEQVSDSHRKLVSTQYLLTAVALAEKLAESARAEEIRRIIGNLLFLSNGLHGAQSQHLFAPQTGTPHASGATSQGES